MKTQPTVHELANNLLAVIRQQEAGALARAIMFTQRRHQDGFMARATAKSHLASLWGTVDAKGLRAEVEALIGGRI